MGIAAIPMIAIGKVESSHPRLEGRDHDREFSEVSEWNGKLVCRPSEAADLTKILASRIHKERGFIPKWENMHGRKR